MSQYPVPSQSPPSYGSAGSTTKAYSRDDTRDPLLGSSSGGGAFYDQPGANDLPDDFKACSYYLDSNFEA